jgi:cytidine deaminase
VIGAATAAELQAEITALASLPEAHSTIDAAAATALVERHGLGSVVELALLALPAAGAIARPPISGYRVAAVGIEAEGGDLVLGANLEFPGSELTTTIHAEGFVALRARARGRTLATLAVREAHPCAHCRQTLSESAAADGLTLVDLEGAVLTLADLYPWPFRPSALGIAGDDAGRTTWPNLAFLPPAPPPAITVALLDVGRRAHAPYSGAPSAVVLRTTDGRLHAAGCVESVAFNPSISALQATLVEVVAAGLDLAAVTEGWLAMTDARPVDPEPGFRALLRAVAPDASAQIARWRPS